MSGADPRLAAKMRHWKMGLRGSHVTSWLLDRRIDWGSSGFDPLINEAILVYRAFDSWEGTKRYMVDMLGNDTWKAAGQLMEFTYYAPADPTSVSPEGHNILRAEECFPYPLHGLGGPEAWDGDIRHELLAARNRTMAELVPDWERDGARPVRVDAARQLAPEPGGEVRPGGRAATSARTSGSSTACPTACRSTGSTCPTACGRWA